MTVQGYRIIARARCKIYSNYEFVLGYNENAPCKYATWKRNIPDRDCYWGHYFDDIDKAYADLYRRALETYEY